MGQFRTGDVVVAMSSTTAPFPPAGMESHLYIYSGNGTLTAQLLPNPSVNYFMDLASRDLDLFGVDGFVFRVAPDGVSTPLVHPISDVAFESLVFDARRNIYAAGGQAIGKFGPDGTYVTTMSLATSVVNIDLAADQCTMLYPLLGAIQRYDVCVRRAISAIPTSPPLTALSRIRILLDGSMLVTSGIDTFLLDPSGRVLRSYPLASLLALDTDTHSFWAAVPTGIHKLDIQTGAVLVTIPRVSGFAPTALTVIGEPRAAISIPAAIPATTGIGLILLALLLTIIALVRLR